MAQQQEGNATETSPNLIKFAMLRSVARQEGDVAMANVPLKVGAPFLSSFSFSAMPKLRHSRLPSGTTFVLLWGVCSADTFQVQGSTWTETANKNHISLAWCIGLIWDFLVQQGRAVMDAVETGMAPNSMIGSMMPSIMADSSVPGSARAHSRTASRHSVRLTYTL